MWSGDAWRGLFVVWSARLSLSDGLPKSSFSQGLPSQCGQT